MGTGRSQYGTALLGHRMTEKDGTIPVDAGTDLASAAVEKADTSKDLCKDMFEKLVDYLNGELAVTVEEYQLLLKLNQMTTRKYEEMTALASRLQVSSQGLNEKFSSLQSYCDQIDQVVTSVSSLEQTAYRLERYCKKLEDKFKAVERH